MPSHNTKVIAMGTFLSLDAFTQYKSDSNVDFPIVDAFTQYKSDSTVDFPIVGCLHTIQKW